MSDWDEKMYSHLAKQPVSFVLEGVVGFNVTTGLREREREIERETFNDRERERETFNERERESERDLQ